MNILFVGNSFTYFYDVPYLFEEYGNRAGLDLSVDALTKGGWTLGQFGDIQDDYGKKLRELLNSGKKYDRVILQEQSSLPIRNYSYFAESIEILLKLIYDNNPQADVTLYATWGYKDGHEDLIPLSLNSKQMMEGLKIAYHKAAEQFSLKVVDVGEAFYLLQRDSELDPYYKDLKHPSIVGSTLSAFMHLYFQFPQLKEEDLDLPHLPDKKEGAVVRNLAYTLVRGL